MLKWTNCILNIKTLQDINIQILGLILKQISLRNLPTNEYFYYNGIYMTISPKFSIRFKQTNKKKDGDNDR